MKNFSQFPADAARLLRYVLFDIDDTITTDGYLQADAYAALWRMYQRGFVLVPVTGRPAGWCDMIIRQWPVHAIVGENGAFAFARTPEGYRVLTHPDADPNAQVRLAGLRDACLAAFPQARIARDQFARKYDLAIDFCEDEPRLPLQTAYAIRDLCESHGATAKVSSIHVNAWFGEYDKKSMAAQLLTQIYHETPDTLPAAALYFGDSPNDEPMFAHFPLSCAVANILPFLDKLEKKPAYVTTHASGQGFAEAVDILLKKKE